MKQAYITNQRQQPSPLKRDSPVPTAVGIGGDLFKVFLGFFACY